MGRVSQRFDFGLFCGIANLNSMTFGSVEPFCFVCTSLRVEVCNLFFSVEFHLLSLTMSEPLMWPLLGAFLLYDNSILPWNLSMPVL
jgi:hypothetical protein